jgi:integrase
VKIPPAVTIKAFLLSDGRAEPPVAALVDALEDGPVRFAAFKERYLEARSGGSMEPNSLATARMHPCHLERTLGGQFDLRELTLADLERHLKRTRKEGDPRRKSDREKPISAATLRMEVSSLRSAWNWAVVNKLVQSPFPAKGLEYPKADEQPPFMTWEEIERRVDAGGEFSLWECLYLRKEEIQELVEHVKRHATIEDRVGQRP